LVVKQGRDKNKRSGKSQDRRTKKALAGPAKRTSKKRTSKKLPERRAMIAAARRRIGAVLSAAAKRTRQVDRAASRRIEKLRPRLALLVRKLRSSATRLAKASGRRLRPVGVFVLRVCGRGELWLRRASDLAIKGTTRASAVLTPQRAACGVIVAAALCLVVSQFTDFRSIEIGQPAYAGLTAAAPPTVAAKTPVDVHSYALIPIALLAAACAATMALRPQRRGLGRVIIALGLLSIAVILLVDLPAGLDEGAQASRFSGATAVLENGFYAQLAAAAGLVLGGLLYYARPCRIRINLSGRAASARRRRRRPPVSSRDRAARRPSPPRSGAASARASQP
jgi:hypothetical protein